MIAKRAFCVNTKKSLVVSASKMNPAAMFEEIAEITRRSGGLISIVGKFISSWPQHERNLTILMVGNWGGLVKRALWGQYWGRSSELPL